MAVTPKGKHNTTLHRLRSSELVRLGTGMHHDGGGLYLQVQESEKVGSIARSWLFRYSFEKKAKQIGLGPLHVTSLAEAREKAHAARKQLHDGIDPRSVRNRQRAEQRVNQAITFREAGTRFIASHEIEWKSAKHRQQWLNTLKTYAYPAIGDLPVGDVDTPAVLGVVQPIWNDKTETANRIRQRIELVLDWATTIGYRRGDNPARWKGYLENLLSDPSRTKQSARQARGTSAHLNALPYRDVAAFVAQLHEKNGIAARALEFTILTAARTGDVIGARWSEIDFEARTWTIPAVRMKAGREHRVPLSEAAIKTLCITEERIDRVFPNLHHNSLLGELRRMSRADITVHGFRSTFRDWAGETTSFPHDVVETALAHTVGSKVEAAYRRGDLFEKRRELMDAWARFCRLTVKPVEALPVLG